MRGRNRLAETVTKPVEVIPKGTDVKVHRTGAVRFAQFTDTIPREHERHTAAVVAFHAAQGAADGIEKRR